MQKIDYSHGVDNFYVAKGKTYRNPHEERVQNIVKLMHAKHNLQKYVGNSILDFACGSGEATLALKRIINSNTVKFSFSDPYTSQSLQKRIPDAECLNYTFMDVVNGKLEGRYDLCILSYAFHLVPDNIVAPFTLALAFNCKFLLLIHPHKRGKEVNGFNLLAEEKYDQTVAYLYSSIY